MLIKNIAVCVDDFFRNPEKVVALSNSQIFYRSEVFPGERTKNLLEQEATKSFGLYFANRLIKDVFPMLDKFSIDLRFHKNHVYGTDDLNIGWVHSDGCDLAGLVYLNINEKDIDTGTSMYDKNISTPFPTEDIITRRKFNITGCEDQFYRQKLNENHAAFEETVRFGNKYNRLIAYDANLFHKPNNYKTVCGEQRLTLLFFLNDCKFIEYQRDNINSDWVD
jgi:hypothetical protein